MIFFIHIAPFIEYSNIEYSGACLGVSENNGFTKKRLIYIMYYSSAVIAVMMPPWLSR